MRTFPRGVCEVWTSDACVEDGSPCVIDRHCRSNRCLNGWCTSTCFDFGTRSEHPAPFRSKFPTVATFEALRWVGLYDYLQHFERVRHATSAAVCTVTRETCSEGCTIDMLSNGICDVACDTQACLYDRGSCEETVTTKAPTTTASYRSGSTN